MIAFCQILAFGAIVVLAIATGTYSIVIPLAVCLFLLTRIYRHKGRYRTIAISSYAFYALMGTLAYASYLAYCGSTFAPFFDDSYYFRNIGTIWNWKISPAINYTLFEWLFALISYPFTLFTEVHHYDLLPLNWMLGAVFVTEAVRFCFMVQRPSGMVGERMCVLVVMCNYACIEAFSHLYRDALLAVFLILALNNIYRSRTARGVMSSLGALFVRGANGMILFLYLLLQRVTTKIKTTKATLLVAVLLLTVPGIWILKNMDYSRMGRITTSETRAGERGDLERRISHFKEESGGGGVMSLLRSGNPLVQAMAIPAYMIAPIKVRDFHANGTYNVIKEGTRQVERLRVESLWEAIHLSLYAFLTIPLFYGLLLWVGEMDVKRFNLFLVFAFSLIAVTFISMQVRHKIAFIVFLPILYGYYSAKASMNAKRTVQACSSLFAVMMLALQLL